MSEPIISRERVQAEARAAAQKYSDVNDACPYPFGSEAGRVFRETFLAMRASLGSAAELQP